MKIMIFKFYQMLNINCTAHFSAILCKKQTKCWYLDVATTCLRELKDLLVSEKQSIEQTILE